MGENKPGDQTKAIFIFLLATSFYLYEYVLQVSPSVMSQEIMATYKVEATGLGLISACYFYSYAFMQLPAGLLFDCYGPRRVITSAILFCVFGALFFACTTSIFMACLGRFLIGIGSAFSFIGVLVLVSRWFKPSQFALLAGISQAGSSLGAIFGEYPLSKLSSLIGWRQSMFVLAAIGLILAALVWMIIRDAPYLGRKNQRTVSALKEWRKLLIVMRKPQTWWIGLYAGTSWTPIAIFAVLWGVPYLSELKSISIEKSAALCSIIWVAIGVASPILGWFSDKISNRRYPLMLSSIMGLIASLILFNADVLSLFWVVLGLILLGAAAAGQTLSFSVVKESNLPEYIGSACGFNNMSVLVGAALFQPIYGLILKYYGNVHYVGAVPVYSSGAYKLGFTMIPLIYLAGLLIIMCFIKETAKKH